MATEREIETSRDVQLSDQEWRERLTPEQYSILRKHGKNIIGKQFATKRLADIMIDLFVHACVLSRVNQSILDNGVTAAQKEIEILQVFTGQVRRRVRSNFSKIDNNDDELIKSLADHALENERYIWDNI